MRRIVADRCGSGYGGVPKTPRLDKPHVARIDDVTFPVQKVTLELI
jgi:hypothetical protein